MESKIINSGNLDSLVEVERTDAVVGDDQSLLGRYVAAQQLPAAPRVWITNPQFVEHQARDGGGAGGAKEV